MLKFRLMLLRFAACEQGATAIEYALIASGLSMAIVGAVNALGPTLNAKYVSVSSALN